MSRRAALTAALLVALPTAIRWTAAGPREARRCDPDGRGIPPRHWVGCGGDEGPRRTLDGAERLAFGRPIDVNRASAADLAGVPGLSVRLSEEVVADREDRGPYRSVAELERVRGIGPARLARALPHLIAGPIEEE